MDLVVDDLDVAAGLEWGRVLEVVETDNLHSDHLRERIRRRRLVLTS